MHVVVFKFDSNRARCIRFELRAARCAQLRAVRDLPLVFDRVVTPERFAYEQISREKPLLPALSLIHI